MDVEELTNLLHAFAHRGFACPYVDRTRWSECHEYQRAQHWAAGGYAVGVSA